jgi:hypothetical protein
MVDAAPEAANRRPATTAAVTPRRRHRLARRGRAGGRLRNRTPPDFGIIAERRDHRSSLKMKAMLADFSYTD